MAFYQGAHSFTARNANFINVTNTRDPLTNTMSILDENRAVEATHKSSTAEYAPKCNPKTRKRVIGDIMEWVGAPPAPKSILWFDGPAGAGKTCIMREVVVRCEATPGTVTASYFFSTRVGGLTEERPFIATIAHQLVYSGIPGLKAAILQAISDNPYIFRDGLESQMEALIVEPLRECGFSNSSFAPSRRVVIVIDGLDECRKELERKHLLKLLLALVNKLSLSLIVIIASRPELDIRMTFDLLEFKNATHAIRLHDYDGREDVRIFYCDEFENIRQTHPLRQYIPVGWITEEILQVLIAKSSGHFIYPSVIMKYIASQPRRNPVQLLEKAMAASSLDTTDNPLAELDALYTLILHPLDLDFPLMRRLLHAIMHTPKAESYKTAAFFDEFLRLTPGATDSTLCDLHSVLYIPTPPLHSAKNSSIFFHHKSLEDFLLSSSRSKDLFQSRSDTVIDLALACIWHLQSWASNPIACSSKVLYFADRRCIEYIHKIARSNQALPDAILNFDPRCLFEYRFVHYFSRNSDPEIRNLRAVLHKTHCAGRSECPPLCKGLLLLRDQSQAEMIKFTDDVHGHETPNSRLPHLPWFKTKSGLYPENQSGQVSQDRKLSAVIPVSAWLGEVVSDPTFVPWSLPGPPLATHRAKSIWSVPEAVEPSSKKRKLDSPDGPLAAWDPPKGRLTAKSLFACDYKDRNPDASEKDFERAWRKASKETKADFGARANAAREDRGCPQKMRRREE